MNCDAFRSRLGAVLNQNTSNVWKLIAFASQFLNLTKQRYSVNELEILRVVWSIDYFKYYLYGNDFTVITDHRALLSISKEYRSNKSYNSRLSRWTDRLLLNIFTIDNMPGGKMVLVDYISRNPFAKAKKISSYDEPFVVATISKNEDSFKHQIKNKLQTVQKLDSTLKSPSPLLLSNRVIAPQTPNRTHDNSQNRITAIAS